MLRKKFELVDYQEGAHSLFGTEVLPNPAYPDVYKQIIWDKRFNMPVEVKGFLKNKAGEQSPLYSIRTSWAQWKTTWIPLEVIVETGDPSSKETHHFTLHWAVDFPEEVFDLNNIKVDPRQLKELLLKDEVQKRHLAFPSK